MGLDLYVGTFTRYYARDWKTIIQQAAEAEGREVHILRPNEGEGKIDVQELCEVAGMWRNALLNSLGETGKGLSGWEERADLPYFTDKPDWDGFGALTLWAAYEEHPDMPRPVNLPEEFQDDPAYLASLNAEKTRYKRLLSQVEVWLPMDFPFVFRGPNINNDPVTYASSPGLLADLDELNARTWQAGEAEILSWCEGAHMSDPPTLEQLAKFSFSIVRALARKSAEHNLPMLMDY